MNARRARGDSPRHPGKAARRRKMADSRRARIGENRHALLALMDAARAVAEEIRALCPYTDAARKLEDALDDVEESGWGKFAATLRTEMAENAPRQQLADPAEFR